MSSNSIIVLDNGSSSVKLGTLNVKSKGNNAKMNIPNCIFRSKSDRRRSFISNQLSNCKNFSALFYILPFQKGYLVNWDVQRQIWEHIFGKELLNIKCSDTSVIVTEPHFNFGSIQESMNEIFFEEYGFHSIMRTNASQLSAFHYESTTTGEDCCLVVDSGYSFTHIVPYHNNQKVTEAVVRIDVGGKILTNHLKEIVSYRQLQVMEETYVMNQVKEDTCYVSLDFFNELENSKLKGPENKMVRDYVLPDYTHTKHGYVKPLDEMIYNGKYKTHDQIVRINNERITVPEILFHPADIGIPQIGIPEAIVHSINKCPEELQPHLYRNIVLTGGNCRFTNFKTRVENEVRSLAPMQYQVRVFQSEEPQDYARDGGLLFSQHDHFPERLLTLEEYQEGGQSACQRQFNDI